MVSNATVPTVINFIFVCIQKKTAHRMSGSILFNRYYKRTIPLWRRSSEVVNFLRPFLLRDESTARPFAVAIRLRKPCLFLRFLFEG